MEKSRGVKVVEKGSAMNRRERTKDKEKSPKTIAREEVEERRATPTERARVGNEPADRESEKQELKDDGRDATTRSRTGISGKLEWECGRCAPEPDDGVWNAERDADIVERHARQAGRERDGHHGLLRKEREQEHAAHDARPVVQRVHCSTHVREQKRTV